ncbi:MAG: hypothetical protein KDK72_06865 [Chlamydiia bacterium]|nr:hypothetical protein [Chlamydiia bacterium]
MNPVSKFSLDINTEKNRLEFLDANDRLIGKVDLKVVKESSKQFDRFFASSNNLDSNYVTLIVLLKDQDHYLLAKVKDVATIIGCKPHEVEQIIANNTRSTNILQKMLTDKLNEKAASAPTQKRSIKRHLFTLRNKGLSLLAKIEKLWKSSPLPFSSKAKPANTTPKLSAANSNIIGGLFRSNAKDLLAKIDFLRGKLNPQGVDIELEFSEEFKEDAAAFAKNFQSNNHIDQRLAILKHLRNIEDVNDTQRANIELKIVYTILALDDKAAVDFLNAANRFCIQMKKDFPENSAEMAVFTKVIDTFFSNMR